MATAKIQTVKGLRVEIFSRSLRKNTTRPLTVWIVRTDIERRLFSTGKCAILGLLLYKFNVSRGNYMWSICWDSTNKVKCADSKKIIELIEKIDKEYKQKQPVIVEIESETSKTLCIGVGSSDELCCLDFFPTADGLGSIHPVSQIKEHTLGSIVFWMDSYDCEWERDLLIPYKDAIKELQHFLKYDNISTNLIWELD